MNEGFLKLGIVATVLVLGHLAAPAIRRAREGYDVQTESLAGGMAAAYIFLHLLPELSAAHALVGRQVYFLVLGGFVILYGAEVLMGSVRSDEGRSFLVRGGIAVAYSALIGLTLGEQLPEGFVTTSIFSTALALHLVIIGNSVQEQFGGHYQRWHLRWLLAASTLGGIALAYSVDTPELSLDVMTALLAGFMLFSVIRDEIPDTTRVKFRWFFAGLSFVLLSVIVSHN